jgi:integrase
MASIQKTTTKAGEARYRVRYRVDGRAVELWRPTLEAARAEKVPIEVDAQEGVAIDPRAGARTFDDYFASWLSARLVKGRPLTPATRVGYERLYRRNVGPRLGGRQLRTIRPETVRTWHADITAAAGPDQAAKSYRLLRAVLATAEADELIRHNPCRVRGGGQENTAERPMVATSLVLELADAIEPPYRAMVLLAGFAGLRTGESLGLRRADVAFSTPRFASRARRRR